MLKVFYWSHFTFSTDETLNVTTQPEAIPECDPSVAPYCLDVGMRGLFPPETNWSGS